MTTDIDQAQVTRAVAVLNAAIKHKMAPEGCIPESDADKILEAERILAAAKDAHKIAVAVGKGKVPHYDAIVDVLAEGELFLGIGSAEHEEAVAAQANGSSPELPDAPPAGEEESASAESGDSASPPAGSSPGGPGLGYITVLSKPATNELIYTHEGCDGSRASWMVPLDDCPLPQIGAQEECANCAYVVGITEVSEEAAEPAPTQDPSEPMAQDLWLDAEGQSWEIVTYAGGPQAEVKKPGSEEKTTVPRGFLVKRAPDSPVPPSAPPPTPPAPSAPPAPESTEATDDDEGDETYRKVLDQVEVDYAPSGMPVPQELETPPEGMPDDLTANEVANRRLHSQFNALAARARRLYTIEDAKARGCKRVLERTYLPPAMRAARSSLGKDATVTEVRQKAEEDPKVLSWLERMDRHADRATAYKHFFEIYTENVAVLSRDLTWSETEARGA